MKTALRETVGRAIGNTFAVVVILLPTWAYIIAWVVTPKTFWSIVGTVLAGFVWIFAQIVWGLFTAMWIEEDREAHAHGCSATGPA